MLNYKIHQLYSTKMNSKIGDFCSIQCILKNGQTLVLASIYISLNSAIDDIISFLLEALVPFAVKNSKFNKGNDQFFKGFAIFSRNN